MILTCSRLSCRVEKDTDRSLVCRHVQIVNRALHKASTNANTAMAAHTNRSLRIFLRCRIRCIVMLANRHLPSQRLQNRRPFFIQNAHEHICMHLAKPSAPRPLKRKWQWFRCCAVCSCQPNSFFTNCWQTDMLLAVLSRKWCGGARRMQCVVRNVNYVCPGIQSPRQAQKILLFFLHWRA